MALLSPMDSLRIWEQCGRPTGIPVIYTDDGIIGVDMSNECIIITECSLSVTLLDLLRKILTQLYTVQGFSVGYHRYESTTPYILELRVEQRKESLMIGTFEEM